MNEARAVAVLVEAYGNGFFPMADPSHPDEDLQWLSPDPRGIIPLREAEGLHVPRRVRDRVKSGRFTVTCDKAFEAVMRGCALPRPREPESWIDERIIGLYTAAHRAGRAHSVEAWVGKETGRRRDEEIKPPEHPLAAWAPARVSGVLVGGLYGVHIGAAFFAESMFSLPALGGTDASKVCLVRLIGHLQRRGFELLDTQFWNPHIDQFGCVEIPRREYIRRLGLAIARPVDWGLFEVEPGRQ